MISEDLTCEREAFNALISSHLFAPDQTPSAFSATPLGMCTVLRRQHASDQRVRNWR